MIEMTERPLCPDPEALGMFAEGTASEQEIATIREHLATCNDCLDEVGEVTRAAQDPSVVAPSNVVPIRPGGGSRRGGWLAAAAALVVVAGGAGVWRTVIWDPINPMRRAAAKEDRPIEPRLYRFPHSKFERTRGGENAEHYGLNAAGTAVIADAQDKQSVKMKHAEAVAKLLLWKEPDSGDIPGAVSELEGLTKQRSRDAGLWNDLAAARLMAAERLRDAPAQAMYAQALAAAAEALKINPELREAAFNKALAQEGADPAKAKSAWEEYLRVEQDPEWREEAQKHLDHLAE